MNLVGKNQSEAATNGIGYLIGASSVLIGKPTAQTRGLGGKRGQYETVPISA